MPELSQEATGIVAFIAWLLSAAGGYALAQLAIASSKH